jgi:hypothetical protein
MSETITFVELAGPGARERLSAAAAALAEPSELLQGLDQDDLWLLIVRGGVERPPERARVWRFTTAEHR